MKKMSTELNCIVHQDINISELHSLLREHMIIHNPPYSLRSIIAPYITGRGRNIKIVLHHSNRNVTIVDADIRHHVLQTAVAAFQNHRLQPRSRSAPSFPFAAFTQPIQPIPPTRSQSTGKTCSICMEDIQTNNLQCLPCAHTFHRQCIRRWFRQSTSCPECRLQLT